MTKFIADFEFGSNLTPEQAQEWIETVQKNLPDGAKGSVKVVPFALALEELTQEHAGNLVIVKDRNGREVRGVLEHIFNSPTGEFSKILVVGGTGFDIPAYSVVQLSEW